MKKYLAIALTLGAVISSVAAPAFAQSTIPSGSQESQHSEQAPAYGPYNGQ
jgi:hypothetical protein